MNIKRVKKFPSSLLTCVSICILLAGCYHLKEVRDYSASSLTGVSQFQELGSTFTQACQSNCFENQLEDLKLDSKPCDCTRSAEADSVTFIIYSTLKRYLEGLSKLSGDELTRYKFESVDKSLTEGQFGPVKIDKKTADAYTAITSVLTHLITDRYRSKKIRSFIEQANSSVQDLIDALIKNLETDLNGLLSNQKQRLQSYYFKLVNESDLSTFEKRKAILEYYAAIKAIEQQKQLVLSYTKTLRSIAQGHQKLFDNRDKLTLSEIKKMISDYSDDIQNLINQFNQLKSLSKL